ncbi:MAG: TIGR03936 family radical SAM-associated protein [Lachnospiraceae bacterium]|nr:TIGR03936 family radical SAM-associated protein [Lachnospiraceae bacterium]
MNVRIRFAKYGAVKFIGHLDVMRYFQKAVRRAGLKIAYSQGFHPHQIMSFASPLGVGITSEGEYMDMELTTEYTPKEIVDRLNEAMVEGFTVLSCRILPESLNGRKRETAMSLVTAADYLVFKKQSNDCRISENGKELRSEWARFYGQRNIPVVKKVKKSNTETSIDLKPFLYGTDYYEVAESDAMTEITPHIAGTDYYELETIPDFTGELKELYKRNDWFYVPLRVSAGSADNIKPELVMEAFALFLGCEDTDSLHWQIHRLDMYTGEAPELKRL